MSPQPLFLDQIKLISRARSRAACDSIELFSLHTPKPNDVNSPFDGFLIKKISTACLCCALLGAVDQLNFLPAAASERAPVAAGASLLLHTNECPAGRCLICIRDHAKTCHIDAANHSVIAPVK